MKKHLFVAVALSALISMSSVASAQDAGFGDGIPLQMAVKRIVPAGMEVSLAAGVDGSKRVSWTGEGGWRQALEQAMAGTGYTYSVNNGKVVITAAPVQVASTASAPKPEAAAETAAPRRAQSNKPSAPARPRKPAASSAPTQTVNVPVVPGAGFVLIPEGGAGHGGNGGQEAAPAADWVVVAGMDLHDILDQWATKSGWRLVWESEYSYSLTSAAAFRGDFVTASTELLRSMQDVRPVPTATFFQGNKVLVIANNGLDEAN